jgi:hypothetical protein
METKKFGELIVSVYKEGNLSPVPNSQVEISDMNGNLIKTLQTNEFGNIEKIKLPVFSNQNRLSDNVKPHDNKYIVTVKHPKYQPVRMIGIEILEGSTSLPEVELSSLRSDEGLTFKTLVMEEPKPSNNKKFQNPYNILSFPMTPASFLPISHLPGSGSGLALPGSGPALPGSGPTLPIGLVIPEFVRVHLGPPDSNARNVDVPFIDYIKSVIHAEIKGFTEDEAIRANVVAVVSFTLNRIYTEHYRRKNKDFHITNDTNVDHNYLENYTPLEPLRRNVEEFFNEYVEYPENRLFPFLTQYCNGNEVKCAHRGMLEQIPTRDLAKNGKKYKDILKQYYGRNFTTVSAAYIILKGNIYSFITPLKLGSSGSDVRSFQQYLKVIGKNYKIKIFEKAIEEEGEFKEKTDAAVRLFQKVVMKLSKEQINGVIDQKTWYVILNRYLIAVEERKDRNYLPLYSPPQSIPIIKYELKSVLDLFNHLASWVYIWTKETGGKEGFWFWPTYIGVNRFQGYTWKEGSPEASEIYDHDIHAFGYPNNTYSNRYRTYSPKSSQFESLIGHFFIIRQGIRRLQLPPNIQVFIRQVLFDPQTGEENVIIAYPVINNFGTCTGISTVVTSNELFGTTNF